MPDLPLLIPIPARIRDVKAQAPEVAVDWRRATRAALATRVGASHDVAELLRGEGSVSHYLLEPPRPGRRSQSDARGVRYSASQ